MRAIRWIAWILVVLVAGATIAVLVSDDVRDIVLGTPGDGTGIDNICLFLIHIFELTSTH